MFSTPCVSRDTCHVSPVIYQVHVPPVTRQVLHVTFNPQTIRSREPTFWENVHPQSHSMCSISHVTCHVRYVNLYTYIISNIYIYIFFFSFSLTKVLSLSVKDLFSMGPTPSSWFVCSKIYLVWLWGKRCLRLSDFPRLCYVSHRVAMSVCSVVPSQWYLFQDLSLALRSHDQFQGLSLPHPS